MVTDSSIMRHLHRVRRSGRIRAWVARRRRDEHGATLVEAAFVMPVFVLMVFGVIEFSGYVMSRNAANAAVKAGARSAVVAGNDSMADREILLRMKTEGSGLVAGTDRIVEIKIWRAASVDAAPPTNCTAATSCNEYLAPTNSAGAYVKAALPLTTDTDPAAAMGSAYADCYFGAATSADTDCTGSHTLLDAGWPPRKRRTLVPPPGRTTCNDGTVCPTDMVGIWIKVQHNYYTGFFGSSVTFDMQSVAMIEPQGYDK